jgi:hypothetical protein
VQQQIQERKTIVSISQTHTLTHVCDIKIIVSFHLRFCFRFRVDRETEQFAKREEVWKEIEELARKNNPQFEGLINHMEYLSISQNQNNNWNENDYSSDNIDQYSKDVRRII